MWKWIIKPQFQVLRWWTTTHLSLRRSAIWRTTWSSTPVWSWSSTRWTIHSISILGSTSTINIRSSLSLGSKRSRCWSSPSILTTRRRTSKISASRLLLWWWVIWGRIVWRSICSIVVQEVISIVSTIITAIAVLAWAGLCLRDSSSWPLPATHLLGRRSRGIGVIICHDCEASGVKRLRVTTVRVGICADYVEDVSRGGIVVTPDDSR